MRPSILQRLRMVLVVLWRRKRYLIFIVSLVAGPIYFFFTQVSFFLDPFFFPELKKTKVKGPVFILGHPRSGTTFFQRLIGDCQKLSKFFTWELTCPALIQRKLLAPLVHFLDQCNVNILQDGEMGHEIRLCGIDEDESLFLHFLDSDMLTFYAPEIFLDTEYQQEAYTMGWDDLKRNTKPVNFFKECLRRQIVYSRQSKVIANTNPSIFRIRTFLSIFPDAKFVYIYRDPQETIPSFLSLFDRFIYRKFSLPEEREFFKLRYNWSKDIYNYFEKVKHLIPDQQLLILTFPDIISKTQESVRKVFEFGDIQPEEAFWHRLRKTLAKPHQKKHCNNPLCHFGISYRQIRKDFGHIIQKYS